MSTLRGRLPVLLSELIAKGYRIRFDFHLEEPLIDYTTPANNCGHIHLDRFIPEEHGANMQLIEQALLAIAEQQ
jgi:hypothetical protein